MSLRLAVATEDFGTHLKQAIGLAGTCEVPGLRLNCRTEVRAADATQSSLRQILLYVRERQMKIAGLLCPTRHSLYDSEYLEERLSTIRNSLSLARKLDTSELLIRCGRIPDPESNTPAPAVTAIEIDEQANPFSFAKTPTNTSQNTAATEFALLCEILNDLTQHGNHVGCTLNLQLSTYNLPLVNRLLAEVKAGPIKIAFDPATAVMTAANVVRTYRDIYQNVGYIRARDALRDIDGAGVEVAVGDGTVDWTQFMPTLSEADFNGWICVERTGGDERAEDVRKGVSLLKSLIPLSGG